MLNVDKIQLFNATVFRGASKAVATLQILPISFSCPFTSGAWTLCPKKQRQGNAPCNPLTSIQETARKRVPNSYFPQKHYPVPEVNFGGRDPSSRVQLQVDMGDFELARCNKVTVAA